MLRTDSIDNEPYLREGAIWIGSPSFNMEKDVNALLKIWSQIAVLTMLLFLTACAGTSTFTAYPHKIQPLVTAMVNRTPVDLSKSLLSERKSNDLILYNMEHGRYAHVTGNSNVSMEDFKTSIDKIRANDEKALISASAIAANMAATLVNDNAIPYEGDGYERVLLHQYQALNYLKKKDLDGAGVEVRRANAEQNDSLKRFEKELEKSREEAAKKKINAGNTSNIETQYAQMDEIAGKVKNSFQNAYTFYVSGIIYELLQQENDAYIDYKKALEIYPENSYLQKDVIRLAAKLGMRKEFEELKQRFPGVQTPVAATSTGFGEILVLFEDGFVPQKHEVMIPIPAGKAGVLALAFPIYWEKWSTQTPLRIFGDNGQIGATEPICDVRALAVKALKEKIPVIATRQIVRAVVKGVAAAEAKKKMGDLGQFATNVWNLVSESADLRSWLTLPANAQIMRATLPSGKYRLSLQHPMAVGRSYADVEIPPDGKAVLQVIRTGGQLYTSVTSFAPSIKQEAL